MLKIYVVDGIKLEEKRKENFLRIFSKYKKSGRRGLLAKKS